MDVTCWPRGGGLPNLTRLDQGDDRPGQPTITIEDLREVSDDLVVIVAPQLMLLGVSDKRTPSSGSGRLPGINLDFTAAERRTYKPSPSAGCLDCPLEPVGGTRG